MADAGEPRPENPFTGMHINDTAFLQGVQGRSPCIRCNKSRKFFCYGSGCYVPVAELTGRVPFVKLPIKIDIIKHRSEIEGKSTAVHAAVLAPEDVTIFTYPDIPDYRQEQGVVLIFPTPDALTVTSLFSGETIKFKDNYGLPKGYHIGTLLKCNLNDIMAEGGNGGKKCQQALAHRFPVRKAVFIDSTWSQCRGIYKDERVGCLQTVVIQNRISQFWRHQKDSPRWFLATVEAIHQFLIELHITAYGLDERYQGLQHLGYLNFPKDKVVAADRVREEGEPEPYNGQYDNLLFFFLHMYNLIHEYYEHHTLRAYRRPLFLEDKYQKKLLEQQKTEGSV